MVKFGPLDYTFTDTVEWAGPATLKVGRKATLTMFNYTARAETLQVIKETTILEDQGVLGIIEMGTNFKVIDTQTTNPSVEVVGPGTNKTWKGREWIDNKSFSKDRKYQERWYVTYVPPPPTDYSGGVATAAEVDSLVVEDDPLQLGPTFDTPVSGQGSVESSGDKSGLTIILLIIAVLVGAGAGWAAKGALIKRMLGTG